VQLQRVVMICTRSRAVTTGNRKTKQLQIESFTCIFSTSDRNISVTIHYPNAWSNCTRKVDYQMFRNVFLNCDFKSK
jgi:hypothetical protein